MTAPRWTYSEANAARWRPLFDTIIRGETAIEIPLADNGKTLTSLKVRVGDALKWLADQYNRHRNESFKEYYTLKHRMRYLTGNAALILKLRGNPSFQPTIESNIDAATVRRMVALITNEQAPPQSRKKFAAVVIKSLTNVVIAHEIIKGGFDIEQALTSAQAELKAGSPSHLPPV
jgi:hypothetical protein